MFNKYYQDELSYLRELGREFARANPEAAHFLGEAGADPDVERLLEGFAFLTARIRQKLDDEIPELTHSLVDLFWPHYLRPIPAMTIVQFEALPQASRETRRVPAGSDLDSAPVDGTACRFRTAYDATLLPLALEAVELRTETPPRLRLRIRMAEGAGLPKAKLQALRLHLAGDAATSRALYLCLCRYLRRVTAGPAGAADLAPLAGAAVSPAGMKPEEALLPHVGAAFSGFRLLQEYFTFPAKFMFVDVTGLDRLAELGDARAFDLAFEFSRLPQPMPPVSAANVLLHCAPAVNLFRHEADPIRVDHERTEYPLRPAGQNSSHYEVYSVDRVSGLVRGTARPRDYRPLFRFARPAGEEAFAFRTRLAPSMSGEGTDTFLSLLLPAAPGEAPEVETLSIEVTCTNRQLPAKLRVGDVAVKTAGSPEFARFRNLTRPTGSVPPPHGEDLHWRLLSHLALNYLSLADLEALKGVLGVYNFRARVDRQAEHAHKLLLEGIKRVSGSPSTRLFRGAPVRGVSVEVDLEEDNFAGEGEAYLFGAMLNEFFARYVTLNGFSRLTVRGLRHGEIHEWPTRIGERVTL